MICWTVCPERTNEFDCEVAKQEVRTFLLNGRTYSDHTVFVNLLITFELLNIESFFLMNGDDKRGGGVPLGTRADGGGP